MIANISADRTEFQNRIDSIKQYMDLRGVGKQVRKSPHFKTKTPNLCQEEGLKTQKSRADKSNIFPEIRGFGTIIGSNSGGKSMEKAF